jgi:RND family efflux transporter MFP subunit
VHAESGQVVSAGQAVFTLAAGGEREVLVSIPESRVDELRNAKSLLVGVWARPGHSWTGRLRELAPDTDSVTRTYAARIAIEQPDETLRLGMTATVFAPDVEGRRAIRVPLTAVLHQGPRALVWLVDPKSAQVSMRDVQLGSAQGSSVIVTGGLTGGETVVTAGVHMLHAGQKVKPINSSGIKRGTPLAGQGLQP